MAVFQVKKTGILIIFHRNEWPKIMTVKPGGTFIKGTLLIVARVPP